MNPLSLALCMALVAVSANAAFMYRKVPILTYDDIRNTDGQHSLRYVTADGTSFTENGHFKPISGITRGGGNNYAYVKEGSYSFTSPEGQFYKVDYIADENGYRATGAHLPRQPTAFA